ncbi:DsrE family protein [Tropicimonas sp. IMCC6043]|uniref:DsrE family protein n=1 Tax=Tropicimonas sp. IMCC6043 TaxID=2510645 RepID=UPI00101E0201|nr:DsrE family protein [Tropicimonas sp. IMCC6043]RYH11559.1 hypothetical protein EU800_02665 [Tropicimonas sp. IMCC6043]
MKTILTALGLCLLATGAFAEGMVHKVAIHVDQNDPQVLNMALNNVQNLNAYYEEMGDTVEVELVAYGPGLLMLMADKSPVRDRISTMGLEMENLTFSACGNTIQNIEKKTGAPVSLVEEAQVVPSGVARLVELQEQGFSYVRP